MNKGQTFAAEEKKKPPQKVPIARPQVTTTTTNPFPSTTPLLCAAPLSASMRGIPSRSNRMRPGPFVHSFARPPGLLTYSHCDHQSPVATHVYGDWQTVEPVYPMPPHLQQVSNHQDRHPVRGIIFQTGGSLEKRKEKKPPNAPPHSRKNVLASLEGGRKGKERKGKKKGRSYCPH